MAETSFLHEELMQEEELSIRELPAELQRQVKGFNVTQKKYEENPTEKEENRLVRLSTQIANNIQNWLENQDNDDDDDNDDQNSSANTKTTDKEPSKDSNVSKRRSVEKDSNENNSAQKSETQSAPKKPVSTGVSFGNFVMEKKIKAICDANGGRIKISQLVGIINKEPDYPEQKVHTIKLRKVFLSSDYRIV